MLIYLISMGFPIMSLGSSAVIVLKLNIKFLIFKQKSLKLIFFNLSAILKVHLKDVL